MNLISISKARTNLPNLVNNIDKTLERTVLTVHGKPKAVLLSIEELEALEETAEILAIPGAKESIKEGQEQIKRGEYVKLSDLK